MRSRRSVRRSRGGCATSGDRSPCVPIPEGRWWTADFAAGLGDHLAGAGALLLLSYTPPPDREREAWSRHEREVNAAGARRVIEVAESRGVRVVFTSSADVYGARPGDGVGEGAALEPATPYGEAKREVEEVVSALAEDGRRLLPAPLDGLRAGRERAAGDPGLHPRLPGR